MKRRIGFVKVKLTRMPGGKNRGVIFRKRLNTNPFRAAHHLIFSWIKKERCDMSSGAYIFNGDMAFINVTDFNILDITQFVIF